MNGAQALTLWGDAARVMVDGTIAIVIGTAAYFLVFLPLAVLLGRTLLKRAGEQLAPLPEPAPDPAPQPRRCRWCHDPCCIDSSLCDCRENCGKAYCKACPACTTGQGECRCTVRCEDAAACRPEWTTAIGVIPAYREDAP